MINFIDKLEQRKYSEFLLDKDIIISSSYYDNFSISIVEGMAAGLVPVVTRETGMSEFIESGKNGFCYDYGDILSIKDILQNISSNLNKLTTVSLDAKKISKQVLWENIAVKYLTMYNRLTK